MVFIPVYDRAFPNKGVRAVMEVMMQQGAAEPMAEVITYISSALNLLQVCLPSLGFDGRLLAPSIFLAFLQSVQLYISCPGGGSVSMRSPLQTWNACRCIVWRA